MRAYLIAFIILLLLMFASNRLASAHCAPSGWCYPSACCDGTDCHSVECAEMRRLPDGGVQWRNIRYLGLQVTRSGDGECHVCVYQGQSGPRGTCAFVTNEG